MKKLLTIFAFFVAFAALGQSTVTYKNIRSIDKVVLRCKSATDSMTLPTERGGGYGSQLFQALNGTMRWKIVNLEDSIIKYSPPIVIGDSTFRLDTLSGAVKVAPYAAKKVSNPGYPYFYTMNPITLANYPSYYNNLFMDGNFNATSLNATKKTGNDVTINQLAGSYHDMSAYNYLTGFGSELKLSSEYEFNYIKSSRYDSENPAKLVIGSSFYGAGDYLVLDDSLNKFTIRYDTTHFDKGVPPKSGTSDSMLVVGTDNNLYKMKAFGSGDIPAQRPPLYDTLPNGDVVINAHEHELNFQNVGNFSVNSQEEFGASRRTQISQQDYILDFSAYNIDNNATASQQMTFHSIAMAAMGGIYSNISNFDIDTNTVSISSDNLLIKKIPFQQKDTVLTIENDTVYKSLMAGAAAAKKPLYDTLPEGDVVINANDNVFEVNNAGGIYFNAVSGASNTNMQVVDQTFNLAGNSPGNSSELIANSTTITLNYPKTVVKKLALQAQDTVVTISNDTLYKSLMTGGGGGDVVKDSLAFVRNHSRAATFLKYPSDKVGIGTNAPNQQLELTENFRMPKSIGSTVGVIYHGAKPFLHDYGRNNLFLGNSAGNFTTTAIQQIGIGDSALRSISTASGTNIAIGGHSMEYATTASANVAIGINTLLTSNTDANVAIGNAALYSLNGGAYSTALGSAALSEMSSGTRNVAVGAFAGRWQSTGDDNVWIGNNAGEDMDSTDVTNSIVIGSNTFVTRAPRSHVTTIGTTRTKEAYIYGTLNTIASTTARASLRLPHGTAPSSPTNGDMWTTTAGLYARINGNTIGPYSTGGLSNSLSSGYFWVGNALNAATAVQMSGGATMDNAGAVTLADVTPSAKGAMTTAYLSTLLNDSSQLKYANFAGFVDNSQSSLSFNPTDSTLTLTKSGATLQYQFEGRTYSIPSTLTKPITFVAGRKAIFYFYINAGDLTLSVSTVPWTLKDSKIPVAIIDWDFYNGIKKFQIHDERHTATITRKTHYYLHSTVGTRYQSGLLISGETVLPATASSANNQFKIAAGELDDEDLDVTIAVKGKPTTASHPWTWYKRTAADVWSWDTLAVPYVFSATYPRYDVNGTMTTGTSGNYYNSYLLATNTSDSARFIIISGRGSFASLATAQAENPASFNLSGISAETVILYQMTWFTGSSFTGALGRCKLAATPRFIGTGIATSTQSVPVTGWVVEGNNVIQSTSGNVGIADASTPRYSLSIVHAAAGVNIVDKNYNLNRTDSIQAADTASFKVQIVGGNPVLSAKNSAGVETFGVSAGGNVDVKGTITGDTLTTVSNGSLKIYANGTGDVTLKNIRTATFDTLTANTSSSNAVTIDWTKSNVQTHALSENVTFTFTSPGAPCSLTLKIVHAANTNVYTTTWPAAVKWAGGTAITTTATSSAIDVVTFFFDGTNYLAIPLNDFK